MARCIAISQVRLAERWASKWRRVGGCLGRLGGGGGGGQLGVGDAAVAGEAAAGGRGWDVDFVGKGVGEGLEAGREAEAAAGAGRMDGGGADLLAHLERGQQAVVGPGDGVENLQLPQALGVGLGEDAVAGFERAGGAGGGVEDDRQRALPAPCPEPLDHLVGLLAVRGGEAFRAPGQAAAAAGDVVGDPDREPGALGDGDQCRRRRAGEDPVGAGGDVDRRGALAPARRRLRRRRPGQAPAALGPPRQQSAEPQPRPRGALDRAPALRRRQRRLFGALGVAALAQFLDHLARVDPDRASELAGAVGGAGLQRLVLELLQQRPLHRRARRLARHLAPQDDPLARGRRQVAARADRLAEATLDAGGRGLLDRRRRFQVAQMDAGVAVEEDVGREDAVGVGQPLHPPHQLGRPLPPLALYIRGHVDPGPVLGLERAVVLADDQLDQLAHECLVALQVLRFGEVRGQHEVEVAGRGVAGDAGEEAVLGEQRLQVFGPLGDPLRRHADVLDDQRRPRQPQLADQPVQTLAHAPAELDLLRLAA